MTVDLPTALREEWRVAETDVNRRRLALLGIVAETTIYEPKSSDRPRNRRPLRTLFTVDLTFEPPLTAVGLKPSAVASVAVPTAKRRFVAGLEERGFVVCSERDATRFRLDDGTRGNWYVFDVKVPVGPSDVEGADEERIAGETHVVIWPTETAYRVAGGTVPLEGPAGSEDGVPIDPESGRTTIREFVRAISGSNTDARSA